MAMAETAQSAQSLLPESRPRYEIGDELHAKSNRSIPKTHLPM